MTKPKTSENVDREAVHWLLGVLLLIVLSGCETPPVAWDYRTFDPKHEHQRQAIGFTDCDGTPIHEGDILIERGELDRYIVRWEGNKGYVMHHDYNDNHCYCATITQKEMDGYGDDQLHEGFRIEGSVYK